MFELLRSFTAVLDEFGVSHGRAKKAALCAAEGLMMVGHKLLSFKQVILSFVTIGWFCDQTALIDECV